MEEYVYGEIEPQHRIYVGDKPLAEYAEGRVDSLIIEPDDANTTALSSNCSFEYPGALRASARRSEGRAESNPETAD